VQVKEGASASERERERVQVKEGASASEREREGASASESSGKARAYLDFS